VHRSSVFRSATVLASRDCADGRDRMNAPACARANAYLCLVQSAFAAARAQAVIGSRLPQIEEGGRLH
jgi:hypothetical protein